MINKSDIFKYSLIFLIILTCITDIITFFTSGLYEFEINPIILFFNSIIGMYPAIAIAVVIKAFMVLYIAYYLYKYQPKRSHIWAYLIVYISIIIIAVQIFGTYSNISVAIDYHLDPINVQPVPVQQTVKLLNIVNLIYYITTFISLLSFWVYENIYRIRPK